MSSPRKTTRGAKRAPLRPSGPRPRRGSWHLRAHLRDSVRSAYSPVGRKKFAATWRVTFSPIHAPSIVELRKCMPPQVRAS
jgi:hypothetical protein